MTRIIRLTLMAGALIALTFLSGPVSAGRFGGGGFRGGGGGGFNRGGGSFGGGGGYNRGGGGNFGGGGFNRGGGNFGGGNFGGGDFNRGGGNFNRGGSNFGSGNFGGGSPMSHPSYQRPEAGRSNFSQGAVHGPFGGSGTSSRDGWGYTGPRGGYNVGGQRSFSGTTGGGGSINAGERGNIYTGPRGSTVVAGGKGGSYTGPGGNTVAGGKGGAVVVGPNGNVHATGGRGVAVQGPHGAAIAGSHGAVTAGPGGVTAHGGRGVAGTGTQGSFAAGSRGAVAVGPHGAAAAAGRGAIGTGPAGTYATGTRFVGASTLQGHGYAVRNSFSNYNAFRPGWFNRYPGAWYAAGWAAGAAWNSYAWSSWLPYVGYAETQPPYLYNYGDNVYYQDGSVYSGDQVMGTEQQYYDQAAAIATTGQQAQPPADDKWQALGVFAMTVGDATESNDIFQLALDQNGILRGNYYNAVTDKTTPVAGSLDKKTQRIAWTIGDDKTTIYEAGLYNLTQEQTTMLVHFGKDRTEQRNLYKIEQKKDDK